MKVVTVEQMRAIEQRCADADVPWQQLMENAGLAVALEVKRYVEDIAGLNVLVLIGPGNNGGDGLVVARHLKDWGASVDIYLCADRPQGDPNLALCEQRDIPTTQATSDSNLAVLDEVLSYTDVVIDSILGTGKARPIEGNIKQIFDRVDGAATENPSVALVAVDLPSGLDADSGNCDPACLAVDLTITLGYPKVGFFTFPAWDYLGQLLSVDIGITPGLDNDVTIELITPWGVADALPDRPTNANKGTFGRLMAVAGSINYVGAAYLACEAAMRTGTGLVTLATAKSLQPMLTTNLIETTYLPLPESEQGIIAADAAAVVDQALDGYDALLVGCGLGQHDSVARFIDGLLLSSSIKIPLVIDADGLNTMSQTENWWQKLNGDVVITPHPGEMSRLTGLTVEQIQSDRIEIARKYAKQWNVVVVLKGAHTLVASPDGNVKLSAVANSGLASAGTGDVLAGCIAGLLAQGLDVSDAAVCGVYLHGQAGETVASELGEAGMIASDLLPALPLVIRDVTGY
ncbi:MAG: NAD(P)H-hydrate dehydratase [Chloroflexi bacterium]|nr:NAD(P)H-hydrate dehydratase [Chloroflexota bacterium]MBT7289814.1 NAD(P)H-hydrate dehydratase [Chloroflexota bacterium]